MPLKISFKSSLLEKINILSVVLSVLIIPIFVFTIFSNIDTAKRVRVLGASTTSLDPINDNSIVVAQNLGNTNTFVAENGDSIKIVVLIGAVLLIVALFLVSTLLTHLKNSSQK